MVILIKLVKKWIVCLTFKLLFNPTVILNLPLRLRMLALALPRRTFPICSRILWSSRSTKVWIHRALALVWVYASSLLVGWVELSAWRVLLTLAQLFELSSVHRLDYPSWLDCYKKSPVHTLRAKVVKKTQLHLPVQNRVSSKSFKNWAQLDRVKWKY